MLEPASGRAYGSAMRQAIVYRGEDGFWVAECPSLPGCVSQGETREQAVVNIKEAIEGYILTLKEDGLPPAWIGSQRRA